MAARNEKNANRIARRLTAARKFHGWDIDHLAKRSGIHPKWIEKYEATGDVACDDLAELAIALRLPFSHFVESCCLCGEE